MNAIATPSALPPNLTDELHLLIMQFNLVQKELIPKDLLPLEQLYSRASNLQRPNGVRFLSSDINVCLAGFSDMVENFGYPLHNVYWQLRESTRGGPPYYVVRFVFTRAEYALPLERLPVTRRQAIKGLQQLSIALWQAEGFINSLAETAGQKMLCLNFDHRAEINDQTRPSGYLQFRGGQICIV